MLQAAATLIPIHRVSEAPVSPLDAVVHRAGDKLKALQMTRIAGIEADKSDAQALVSDLLDIARIVDPVIAALGEYASRYIDRLDQAPFTDQLLGALEGNATFNLCAAVEQRDAARNEAAAEGDYLYHLAAE